MTEKNDMGDIAREEDRGALGKIEEMVGKLLAKYQELKRDRDELAVALDREREKGIQLEKRLDVLSQDKEKVKTRIDQLLHRLKGLDF